MNYIFMMLACILYRAQPIRPPLLRICAFTIVF